MRVNVIAASVLLTLGACTEDPSPAVLPDLELTCMPASGTSIEVGQTVTVEATLRADWFDIPLAWVELSEGGHLALPSPAPGWAGGLGTPTHSSVTATAVTPGRTTIMMEWTAEETPPIFRQDRNTRCTYDVVAGPPPQQPRLTVGVEHVGTVTSTPAGIACTQASFGPEVMDCAADFAPGRVTLVAVPNPEFGYHATRWTGCDLPKGDVCIVDLTAARRVDACFHDGTAAGMASCP